MLKTERLLNAINKKVARWDIEKTFGDATPALNLKHARFFALKLVRGNAGVRVAPYAGGCFTVFAWNKKAI